MEKEHTLFAKHDQDGNGKLDKTECRAWLFPEETGEMLKYEADHLIEVGDRDKDGKVSYQEMFDAGAYYIGGKLQTQEHDEEGLADHALRADRLLDRAPLRRVQLGVESGDDGA